MGWAILSWIMISVLIGWQAHLTKGRTARAWGFLTFVVLVTFQIMFSRASAGVAQDTGGNRNNKARGIPCDYRDGHQWAINVLDRLEVAENSPPRSVSCSCAFQRGKHQPFNARARPAGNLASTSLNGFLLSRG